MASVKSSKDYRIQIVNPRSFWRYVLIFVLLLALLITLTAGVIGSYYVGLYYGTVDLNQAVVERDELRQRYTEKATEAEQLSQRVAQLELAAEVDHQANEAVRINLVQLQKEIAQLEEKNNFYLSLMRPATGNKGVVVDPPIITPATEANAYRYNLLIKQIATQHQPVFGYIEFELVGKQEEKARRITLKELSAMVDNERIELNFKYFQRIKGTMVLPDGFTPEQVAVKVVMRNPGGRVIEQQFTWLTTED